MSDCNGPAIVSIFIDHSSSEEDVVAVDPSKCSNTISRRNILAFDDAVLETDENGYDSDLGDAQSDAEDTYSRSSSTDLNNFLQIKQVTCVERCVYVVFRVTNNVFLYINRISANRRPVTMAKLPRCSAALPRKSSARRGAFDTSELTIMEQIVICRSCDSED